MESVNDPVPLAVALGAEGSRFDRLADRYAGNDLVLLVGGVAMTEQHDIDAKCAWLAENLLGWEYRNNVTSGMRVGMPHWRSGDGRKMYGSPLQHLNNGNGMLAIIEAMRKKDYAFLIATRESWSGSWVTVTRASSSVAFKLGKTIPDAVINAAYAALNAVNTGEQE